MRQRRHYGQRLERHLNRTTLYLAVMFVTVALIGVCLQFFPQYRAAIAVLAVLTTVSLGILGAVHFAVAFHRIEYDPTSAIESASRIALLIFWTYMTLYAVLIPGCDILGAIHQSFVTLINAPDPQICRISGIGLVLLSDIERLTGLILFGLFVTLVIRAFSGRRDFWDD